MEMNSFRFKFTLVFGLAAVLAIFITRPAHAQDTQKNEPHKKVMIKIVSDDNGKTTMIDTTMEISDSMMMDSINNEIEKVIKLGKWGQHAKFKCHKMPKGFAFDFDIPSIPDLPKGLEELEDFDLEGIEPGANVEDFSWEDRDPDAGHRMIRPGEHGQTLSDILGDFPMDRVKSYSIKDRKHGKRIVIDLNDYPLLERHGNSVIVIREPVRVQRNRNHSGRQTRVYMNSHDDLQKEKQSESSTPPPPAPPAVPDKK